jgi:putative oxidoreductase
MRSIGVLIVRLVVGGLLAGHGAQKLFGWFGGPGLQGTAGWLESLRLRPATLWARVAGGSEFGGGVLTMLGFLNPLGPIAAMGAMAMAWTKVHLGKPVWVTTGGAELPITNIAVLSALSLAGPGKLSIDGLLGIHVPRRLGILALASTLGAVWYGSRRELAAGTTEVAETGLEVGGDPTPSPDDRAALERAGDGAGMGAATAAAGGLAASGAVVGDQIGADAAGGGYQLENAEQDARREAGYEVGVGDAALAGAAFSSPASIDDSPWTGMSGADAGTAMGTGSELGSETADDSF